MISVNGIPVITAHVSLPRVGAWSAVVETASELETGACTLSDSATGTWIGSVASAGGVGGVWTAVIVGGNGGRADLGAAHFRNLSASAIVAALCASASEVPSSLLDPSSLSRTLGFFSVVAGPASHAFEALASLLRVDWRIGQDGGVWFGTGKQLAPPYPAPRISGAILGIGRVGAIVDGLTVRPGDEFGGMTVNTADYYFERGANRAAISLE